MAIFKCKICGGTLEITSGETVATCEYCGTKQTLPKLDDEKKVNLFDRANHFRRNNDFDKAMGIYEQILNEDTEDAESYWSIVLCRYGIEYVEDPSSRKRVPTVNRAQFTSVFDDEDYKSAIKYADAHQKELYEKEATTINEIQKGILAISGQEEPFDVFICYKETDANGRRTQDSVLATELYHELTREGYKVFFSRITLEDKLGTAYEPYIFAALNSSKVMVVLGTRPEHFNAVWVKNEWSRYLALIKQGQKKMLIPAYRDMDPYDLPEEFSHLQAQDMSKLGFMQDLVRGITKLVSIDNTPAVKETVVVQSTASCNVSALVKRGFLALEDGDWNKADEFFELALNQDAEDAQAYLGKLMAELQVKTQSALKNCKEPFDNSTNYQKAIRFADETLKKQIEEQIDSTKENSNEEKFQNAVNLMKLNTIDACNKAIAIFEQIREYRDSVQQIELCQELKNNICNIVSESIKKQTPKNIRSVISLGRLYTVALKSNNTICAVGDVSNWIYDKDLVSVSAGSFHTVGLKLDGTVVATFCAPSEDLDRGQCDVSEWKDIVSISTGYYHTVGLKKDGTVVSTLYTGPLGTHDGQCNVSKWENIAAIAAGDYHTVGLKKDGTVIAVGQNIYRQCNVSEWENIVAISARNCHTIGLKYDGTVVATGYYKEVECSVSKWENIVAIAAGHEYIVGLKADGTVVAVGDNKYGQCNVSKWENIVAIAAGSRHTAGLKADGTMVAVGDNEYNQCDVSNWKNIAQPPKSTSIEELFEQECKKKQYRKTGVCQYCGGSFKGLFTKTCVNCGNKKDY